MFLIIGKIVKFQCACLKVKQFFLHRVCVLVYIVRVRKRKCNYSNEYNLMRGTVAMQKKSCGAVFQAAP